MGKHHYKIGPRPAAESHTAHRYNAPQRGKTPNGFTVKPAKPELVPIYDVRQHLSFDSQPAKVLGAMLLFGTLGSVIKTAQAECVNPRPQPWAYNNVAGLYQTVECTDQDLFYGAAYQETMTQVQSEIVGYTTRSVASYYVDHYTYDCSNLQWGWKYCAATRVGSNTNYQATPIIGYRVGNVLVNPNAWVRKACRNNGGNAQVVVAQLGNYVDANAGRILIKTLRADADIDSACAGAVARCQSITNYVCETPTPTALTSTPSPSPSPSSSEVETTSVTESSTHKPLTLTVFLTPSPIASSSALEPSPASTAEDQPTNPAIIPNEPDPTGPAVGATMAFLGAATVLGASIALGTIIKKRANQASFDVPAAEPAEIELKVPETLGPAQEIKKETYDV